SARPGCASPCVARLLLQVGARALHPARGRRLQLFPLALGGRDAVLDRLADRVLGVRHRRPRACRRLTGTLHRLAAAELDGLRAQALDLFSARPRRDVRADRQPDETAEDEPAETAAAAPNAIHMKPWLLKL